MVVFKLFRLDGNLNQLSLRRKLGKFMKFNMRNILSFPFFLWGGAFVSGGSRICQPHRWKLKPIILTIFSKLQKFKKMNREEENVPCAPFDPPLECTVLSLPFLCGGIRSQLFYNALNDTKDSLQGLMTLITLYFYFIRINLCILNKGYSNRNLWKKTLSKR